MGLTIFPILVSAQSAVGWSQRGVVTALVNFARSMGAAIGVAALGALLVWSMGVDATAVQALLDPAARTQLDPARAASLGDTLATGLRSIYFVMVLVSVLGAFLARRLPASFDVEPEGSIVAP